MSVIDHQMTWDLWSSCRINMDDEAVANSCVNRIISSKSKYDLVGAKLNIPFYIIGCLHYRESSFSFGAHLANGDPLFNSDGRPIPTTHVPKGLGPFTSWVDGAVAALTLRWPNYQSMHWDIVNALENLCSYNGWGSLMYHNVNVPYVWSGTNKYSKGKYSSDGQWDADLVDAQMGCGALLLSFKNLGYDLNEVQP